MQSCWFCMCLFGMCQCFYIARTNLLIHSVLFHSRNLLWCFASDTKVSLAPGKKVHVVLIFIVLQKLFTQPIEYRFGFILFCKTKNASHNMSITQNVCVCVNFEYTFIIISYVYNSQYHPTLAHEQFVPMVLFFDPWLPCEVLIDEERLPEADVFGHAQGGPSTPAIGAPMDWNPPDDVKS